MPRLVSISDENFRRIQELAEPLVDSVDSVLSRLLDSYPAATEPRPSIESAGFHSRGHGKMPPVEHPFEPYNPPDLTHTKVTFATVGNKSLDSPSWNSVLDETVRVAAEKLGEFAAIKKVVRANVVEGQKTDEGYHILSGTGLSVQGQSANDAWRYVAQIARHQGLRVQVQFIWRDKEGAFRPGEGGRLVIEGPE